MASRSTFIKIDRNIMRWRWYKDANTVRVFLHLILNANISDHDFENITVHRGQLVTSQKSLSNDLGLTIKQIRTALEHLKSTGEVAVTQYPKYSLITVLSYASYQDVRAGARAESGAPFAAINGQPKGSQGAGKGQQYKNIKKSKNEKEYGAAPLGAQAAEEIDEEMRWAYQ